MADLTTRLVPTNAKPKLAVLVARAFSKKIIVSAAGSPGFRSLPAATKLAGYQCVNVQLRWPI